MNLPAIRPLLLARAPRVPAVISELHRRMLPAVRGSVAIVAAGLAAEFALRTLANRALTAVGAATRPVAPLADTAGRVSRTVVTEIVVQERFRWPR